MTKFFFYFYAVVVFLNIANTQDTEPNLDFREGILDIRLRPNPNHSPIRNKTGSVEVEFTDSINGNNIWLSVCSAPNHMDDESWGTEESRVACRQLEHQGGWPYTSNLINIGNIAIDDVRCMGYEEHLNDCRYDGEGFLDGSQCGENNLAGVKCYDNADVRLVDGPVNTLNQGIVEVRYDIVDTDWMEVCFQGDDATQWDLTNAGVVCRQLGYPGVMSTFKGSYDRSDEIQSIENFNCMGVSDSIVGCFSDPPQQSSCDVDNKAEVICFLPGYKGCYTDTQNEIFPNNHWQDPSMTIVKCHDYCRSLGPEYIYAGLTGGTYCRCGTLQEFMQLSQLTSDEQCSAPCGGEESQTCGAMDQVAIYKVDENVCSEPDVPHSMRQGDSFVIGSILTYTCDTNYYLIGEPVLQCIMGDTVDSIRWNATLPVCQESPTTGPTNRRLKPTNNSVTITPVPGKLKDDHPVDIGLLVGLLASALIILLLIIAAVCFIRRGKKMIREGNVEGNAMVYPSPVFDTTGEGVDNAYFDPMATQQNPSDYEEVGFSKRGAGATAVTDAATNDYQ